MAASAEFREFLVDLFSAFGPVSIRNMFGGAGVYHAGIMIGLVADDTLYLKVDHVTQPDFEAEGMSAFTYEGKNKPVTMSYWEVPPALLDDPDEFSQWARNAHEAALRAKSGSRK